MLNSFEAYNLIGGTASLSSLISREVRNDLVTKVGSVSYTDYEAVWDGIDEEIAEKEAVEKKAEVKRAQVRLMKAYLAQKVSLIAGSSVIVNSKSVVKALVRNIVKSGGYALDFNQDVFAALKELSTLLEVRVANRGIIDIVKSIFA